MIGRGEARDHLESESDSRLLDFYKVRTTKVLLDSPSPLEMHQGMLVSKSWGWDENSFSLMKERRLKNLLLLNAQDSMLTVCYLWAKPVEKLRCNWSTRSSINSSNGLESRSVGLYPTVQGAGAVNCILNPILEYGLPRWFSDKEPARQCRRWGRGRFIPWVGEDTLEKKMATHFSILGCKIPWTEERGGRQSMGSQKVGCNWALELVSRVWRKKQQYY